MIEYIFAFIAMLFSIFALIFGYESNKTTKRFTKTFTQALQGMLDVITDIKTNINNIETNIVDSEQKFLAELKRYVLAPEKEEPKKEELMVEY